MPREVRKLTQRTETPGVSSRERWGLGETESPGLSQTKAETVFWPIITIQSLTLLLADLQYFQT